MKIHAQECFSFQPRKLGRESLGVAVPVHWPTRYSRGEKAGGMSRPDGSTALEPGRSTAPPPAASTSATTTARVFSIPFMIDLHPPGL